MSKILTQKSEPVSPAFRATCRKCYALIQFEAGEGRYRGQDFLRRFRIFDFNCPQCKNWISLSEPNVDDKGIIEAGVWRIAFPRRVE